MGETYSPEVGWALGDGKEHGDDPTLDNIEAEALYELLEQKVIPEFYRRNEQGIPVEWVARMRESMARLTPRFSTNRTVREYTRTALHSCPASYLARASDKGAAGRNMVNWEHALKEKWSALGFGETQVETRGEQHVFEVHVYLNDIDPNTVRVELYSNGVNGGNSVKLEMKRGRELTGVGRGYIYKHIGISGPACGELYSSGDTVFRRQCGPSGRGSYPMATMTKHHPKTGVPAYISKISEHADVRSGCTSTFGNP